MADKPKSPPTEGKSRSPAKAAKDARRAEALRRNLTRRKAGAAKSEKE